MSIAPVSQSSSSQGANGSSATTTKTVQTSTGPVNVKIDKQDGDVSVISKGKELVSIGDDHIAEFPNGTKVMVDWDGTKVLVLPDGKRFRVTSQDGLITKVELIVGGIWHAFSTFFSNSHRISYEEWHRQESTMEVISNFMSDVWEEEHIDQIKNERYLQGQEKKRIRADAQNEEYLHSPKLVVGTIMSDLNTAIADNKTTLN